MTKDKKKKVKAKEANFEQAERVKIDVRVSQEADARVEALSEKIGTTKNSIFAVGTITFVSAMERVIGKQARLTKEEINDVVERGLREMLAHVG